MTCLICKKEIDDNGISFCSKCRKKPWELRFMALQKKERSRSNVWKVGWRNKRKFNNNSYLKDYWERRRANENRLG